MFLHYSIDHNNLVQFIDKCTMEFQKRKKRKEKKDKLGIYIDVYIYLAWKFFMDVLVKVFPLEV